ncbi:MAG: hypothetical protein EOP84_09045 [Verrucomicrobiaceae bacterium]|nr:MAG: hypothetical protein EOP84_09045 [Verrucomicrobiaceae bacterium]
MKTIQILFATAFSVLAMPYVQAEETKAMPESRSDRLEILKENLTLTPEQIDQIRPILRKQRDQVETLRGDSSLSRAEKLEKGREMIRETAEEIRPLLTPEQRERWGQAAERLRDAVQARVGARDGE